MPAAEFRKMMQNGRTVREFADRLVLLLRNQLRDPEHILRKTQGRNSLPTDSQINVQSVLSCTSG